MEYTPHIHQLSSLFLCHFDRGVPDRICTYINRFATDYLAIRTRGLIVRVIDILSISMILSIKLLCGSPWIRTTNAIMTTGLQPVGLPVSLTTQKNKRSFQRPYTKIVPFNHTKRGYIQNAGFVCYEFALLHFSFAIRKQKDLNLRTCYSLPLSRRMQ